MLATEQKILNETNQIHKANTSSRTDAENAMIADNSQNILPRAEVVRKLRERGEPILQFGESEDDAFKRLRRLEILEPEVNKVC